MYDSFVPMSYTNSNDKAYAEWAYEFGTEDHTPEPEETRDYCAEAHSIAAGESNLLAERAHIVALREEIDYFEAQVRDLKRQNEMLRDLHPAFIAARKPAAHDIRRTAEYISASLDLHLGEGAA